MRTWWRSHGVRIRLTLWYVAAMIVVLGVYVAAVFVFVSASISDSLDRQLRRDFQWASATVDRNPDGTFTWTEPQVIVGEEELPWVQVWPVDGAAAVLESGEATRRRSGLRAQGKRYSLISSRFRRWQNCWGGSKTLDIVSWCTAMESQRNYVRLMKEGHCASRINRWK